MTICTTFYAYGTDNDGATSVTAGYYDATNSWTSTGSVSNSTWYAEFTVTEGTGRKIDAIDSMAGEVPPCGGTITNSNTSCP
jgi:hypothetical protein